MLYFSLFKGIFLVVFHFTHFPKCSHQYTAFPSFYWPFCLFLGLEDIFWQLSLTYLDILLFFRRQRFSCGIEQWQDFLFYRTIFFIFFVFHYNTFISSFGFSLDSGGGLIRSTRKGIGWGFLSLEAKTLLSAKLHIGWMEFWVELEWPGFPAECADYFVR